MGFRLVTVVSNTDELPLDLLKERYGGDIQLSNKNRKSTHKPVHTWRLSNRDLMRTFFAEIMPHSIVKRHQIEIGLRYLDTVADAGKRIGSDAWNIRLECYQAMQLLNKRGDGLGHNSIVPNSPSLGWDPKHRNLTKEQLNAMAAHMRAGRLIGRPA